MFIKIPTEPSVKHQPSDVGLVNQRKINLWVESSEMSQSEEAVSTESMTVAEAKEKYRNGDLTTDDGSVSEPNGSNGFDITFICSDGYFVVTERIVETEIEAQE